MFAEEVKFYSDGFAQVSLIASEAPGEFPLVSKGIKGIRDGIRLAPGSTVYVTGGTRLYMLGSDYDWKEQ